jgi:DNA-directed RNA polymerase subunit beta
MVNTKKYKKISPLVTRIDYSKFELKNFEEPNLLEIQKSSFERFLKLELKALFELYFPITHEKNKKYKVEFAGVKFVESKNAISEQEALAKGKSYEKAIYADLTLVNNESGDVDVAKKTQKNVSSGIFFGNIPMITSSGTFIVNGVEKNVLSQIVRSPGLYVLSQSRARLSAHAHTGYFCELLANRGTLIHFYNTKNNVIKCSIRISTKFDKSKEFTVTSLLKALGMTEAEIIRVFNNDPSIINSLANDTINVKTIFQDKLIRQFRDPKDKTNNSQGLFTSIRSYLTQYTELEKSAPEQAKAVMDKIISE